VLVCCVVFVFWFVCPVRVFDCPNGFGGLPWLSFHLPRDWAAIEGGNRLERRLWCLFLGDYILGNVGCPNEGSC